MKYEEVKKMANEAQVTQSEVIDGFILAILKNYPDKEVKDIELVIKPTVVDGMISQTYGVRIKD